MSYNANAQSTLFADDILAIQTLFPYNGNGSNVCYSDGNNDDILTDQYFLPKAICDVNSDGRVSSLDLIQLQRIILGYPPNISPYGQQKGSAINSNNTTTLSAEDIVKLQRYILGYDSYSESITNDQWIALADANLDGILNSQDITVSDLDNCPYLDLERNSFTTEVQSSCALIGGYDDYLSRAECMQWKLEF
jgi:hypothetical protein